MTGLVRSGIAFSCSRRIMSRERASQCTLTTAVVGEVEAIQQRFKILLASR